MAFIEYLLDRLDDPERFERLCCQVLLKEGYASINPVGGRGDKGRDAEVRIYGAPEGGTDVLFQFSLEKNIRTKVQKTLKRISECGLQADRVVFVFSTRLRAADLRDSLVDMALEDYGLLIEIRDQRYLSNRLGLASYRDIVREHFAEHINQLTTDLEEGRLFATGSAISEREKRCLIGLMSYVRHPQSDDVRKGILEQAVHGVLYGAKTGVEAAELANSVSEYLPVGYAPNSAAVDAVLHEMQQGGEVTRQGKRYVLREGQRNIVESQIADIAAGRRALLARVCDGFGVRKGVEHDRIEVERATEQFFFSLFRQHGTEVANALLGAEGPACGVGTCLDRDSVEALLCDVVGKWDPARANRFRAALRSLLASPGRAELQYMGALSRSFVCMHVLNVNPEAVNIQRSRLRDSVAVLDTDVVLTGIVEGADREAVSQAIVRMCDRLGVTCFAFAHSVEEILNRIERSVGLYEDLGRPTHIPADKADLVSDIFLDIFFHELAHRRVGSFEQFMSRYYSLVEPSAHVHRMVEDRLGIRIEQAETYRILEQQEKLDRIKETIEGSRANAMAYKNEKLYAADATAMLVVEQQNREKLARGRQGRWYLVSGDRHILNAYLKMQQSFKMKPSVLPVYFLELLRQSPGAGADETAFGAILASQAMLRGPGRNYAPILAAMTRVGIAALALPKDRLMEVIDEMDRADLSQWLVSLRSGTVIPDNVREEIKDALEHVIAESASRTYEMERLKKLAQAEGRNAS